MTTKRSTQNSNNINRNTTSKSGKNPISKNTISDIEENVTDSSQNANNNTLDYVSGDSARSSSSHTFHRNTSDEN